MEGGAVVTVEGGQRSGREGGRSGGWQGNNGKRGRTKLSHMRDKPHSMDGGKPTYLGKRTTYCGRELTY